MPDMRFAPPNPLRIADRATGLNSGSVRSYNERLVLSLLLQKEATTRLEIGEKTGLSAQTISVLVRSLEQEGLVAKGEAQKGRVGPPTVPIVLNPEGAFSVGIGIGAQHSDVVLIDFVGEVRFHAKISNPERDLQSNHSEFIETIRQAVAMVPDDAKVRLAGAGLALPQRLANGRNEEAYFKALQEEIEGELGIAVFVQNDITAAASGESMFGVAKPLSDYLYFYLGAKLHGRLVLNHQIYNGNSPVTFDVGTATLAKALEATGHGVEETWLLPEMPEHLAEVLDSWERRLIDQIRQSLDSINQFVEFETVVLSSYVPTPVCRRLCERLQAMMPEVTALAGTVTPAPKAVGAASLPFSSRFMVA